MKSLTSGFGAVILAGIFLLPLFTPAQSKTDTNSLAPPNVTADYPQDRAGVMIAVEVSQPENMVWLVRPLEALPAGEYALMLGTQNMRIFPFTVSSPANDSAASVPNKR